MIALLLLALPASAIDREDVLDNAAIFTTHEWTMGSANQYGSCSSSYVSDYSPGVSYRGIPYDWGGWVTTDEYDDYLAAGYGAGSHSWHGVLSCTVGVDCSGFVSQAWETSIKYGTSTFYQVTSDISVTSLLRGDALNNAGSHIVLFAYQTAAGLPIHYEANGDLVFVDSDQGWSSFTSYSAVRYDSIGDDSSTGTSSNPIEITSFPYEDLRWTAGAASDAIDSYSCASSADESGPEQLYRFEVATAGTLSLRVSDDDGVDVDIHVMTAASGSSCLSRDDSELEQWLEPGVYWISADTWVGSYEYPGPYLLTATFTGTLGSADDATAEDDEPEQDEPDEGTGDESTPEDDGSAQGDTDDQDSGADGVDDADDPPWIEDGIAGDEQGSAPGQRFALADGSGGGCSSAPASGSVLGLLFLLVAPRRRR